MRRIGFALAAALMAIVLIALMITGALFAASQETHATAAEGLESRAAASAEHAAIGTISAWDPVLCDAMGVGAVIIANPPSDPPFENTTYVTRLDSAVFLVVGEGKITSSGVVKVRRRIAIAVRIARDAQGVEHATRVSEQAWSALYQM